MQLHISYRDINISHIKNNSVVRSNIRSQDCYHNIRLLQIFYFSPNFDQLMNVQTEKIQKNKNWYCMCDNLLGPKTVRDD